jgi:ribose 1,5-bisphosphokinase
MTQSSNAPGAFVAIGGPSGVGKDTLIRYARARLGDDPRYYFVRRTITRAPDDANEDHVSVDDAEFARLDASGAFALSWSAHGLSYGLPVDIDAAIAEGRIVIANISRGVLPQLLARYSRVLALSVSAEPHLVEERLIGRGREDHETIQRRTERVVSRSGEWIELRNSGPVAEAGDALVDILKTAAT